MKKINAKDALITGFYDLVQLRDSYVHHSKVYGGPHKELIDNYMKAQALLLSPIAPHTCEHLWKLLGQTGFIVQASWPERKSLDPSLLEKYAYMQNHIKAFRQKLSYESKKAPKSKCNIFVGGKFPDWQIAVLSVLKTNYNTTSQEFDNFKALIGQVMKLPEVGTLPKKKRSKDVMSFINQIKRDVEERGISALDASTTFSEIDLWASNVELVQLALGNEVVVEVFAVDDPNAPEDPKKKFTVPGKPSAAFS